MEELTNFRQTLPSWKTFREMPPRAKREFRWGMFFISPWIIGFLAFTLIPMVATLIFTFINLRITDGWMLKLWGWMVSSMVPQFVKPWQVTFWPAPG
jgi:ABC-type sugar transport system permease subunit